MRAGAVEYQAVKAKEYPRFTVRSIYNFRVEHRICVEIVFAILPLFLQLGGFLKAYVFYSDGIARNICQNHLRTIVKDHSSQHVMALYCIV